MSEQDDDRQLADQEAESYWYERYHARKAGTDWFDQELDRLVKAGRIVLEELERKPPPLEEPPF
jgi:hypothetical protein